MLRLGLLSGFAHVGGRERSRLRRAEGLFLSTDRHVDRVYPYDGDMANQPSVEEAVERARRAQEDRIAAIRTVAQARQSLADVREQTARELAELQEQIAQRIRQAEQEDVRAYNAAVTAGWTPAELKKIGFPEPEKKQRARRRSTRRTATSTAAKDTPSPPPEQVTEPAPEPVGANHE